MKRGTMVFARVFAAAAVLGVVGCCAFVAMPYVSWVVSAVVPSADMRRATSIERDVRLGRTVTRDDLLALGGVPQGAPVLMRAGRSWDEDFFMGTDDGAVGVHLVFLAVRYHPDSEDIADAMVFID